MLSVPIVVRLLIVACPKEMCPNKSNKNNNLVMSK